MHINPKILIASLLLLTAAATASAQGGGEVKGTVRDETGEPLAGAGVFVKGSKTGTVTDGNGNFTLKQVPEGSVLVVSFISYENQEITASGRGKIEVTLSPATSRLDEAVVIGYGQMKTRDLTGSVTSMRGEQLIEKTPSNVFDMLQGQAAGVQIVSNSGAPGEGATIRIRGTSTFGSGTEPLYIVDDLPVDDISGINPDDIKSIEVLKDAASAAIYGSRSANGVILVTTKQGDRGKHKIDVRYSHSLSSLAHIMPLTTPEQFFYYNDQRYIATGDGNLLLNDFYKPFFASDGNFYKDVIRMADKDEANISASGATEKVQYYMSVGLQNEEGVFVNTGYRRITARSNTTYKASERLTFGSKFQCSYSDTEGPDETNLIASIYDWPSFWSVLDANGETMHTMAGKTNVYARTMEEKRDIKRFNGSVLNFVEYSFNRFLKFRTNLSGTFSLSKDWRFVPSVLITESNSYRDYGNETSNLGYNWLTENYLSYDRTISGHSIGAMVGFSAQDWYSESSTLYGQDYTNQSIWTMNSATVFPAGKNTGVHQSHSMASFFGRATYNWKSRYLVAANLRYDGSSRFSSSNRWGFFPSASLGWRFTDEPWMEWIRKSLSDGKIRASYGVTGNESIGNYKGWATYSAAGMYDGIGGLSPDLVYRDLGWEQTQQFDLGADLSFFEDRLSITFDAYSKLTTDLLYSVEVPKETGYSTMTKNVGSVSNKGVEFSFNWNVIDRKKLKWNVSGNISHNRNIAVKLADDIPFYVGNMNGIYMQTGHPLGEFYGLKHDGIFAYDESNAYTEDFSRKIDAVFYEGIFDHYELDGVEYTGVVGRKTYEGNVLKAGDVNWSEAEGHRDGKIDTDDYQILGCAQPVVYGGFSTTLNWRRISVAMNFDYSLGGQLLNYSSAERNNYKSTWRSPDPEHIAGMWTTPGQDAKYPLPDHNRSWNLGGGQASDFWIEDGSFVKLRSMKVGYMLPTKWREAMRMKYAQVSVYGKNLLCWTNYTGNDPEFGGSVLAFGIDTGKYPRKREFGLTLNLAF